MDRGYVNNFYKGRISRMESNGEMFVMIRNLKPVDAGDYRCVVSSVNHIYSDFHLQIDSGRRSGPVPPRPRVRSTIRPSISSSSSSDTSGPVFPSVSRSVGIPLAAGLCITMGIVICPIIVAVIHRKVRAKKKCGATSSDSAAHILSVGAKLGRCLRDSVSNVLFCPRNNNKGTSLKRRAVLSTPQWTSNLMRTIPQSCMLTYRHSAAPEVMTLTHTESLLGRWCTPHWLATNAEPDCSVSVSFLAWWSQICLCCLDMLS
ncbi:uncharacterized protein [Salmo salar]|uniref:Uncharacterized protein LOC106566405 n=1 Tax=Salmo salar TaxID=8030 RepID=A0ABM3CQM4_SALSA|nr:uncharacterized protein LOC106566405 [Salmo salar]XP_045548869.1 uncharacterized protein LOC106566405 [Salmo salar]